MDMAIYMQALRYYCEDTEYVKYFYRRRDSQNLLKSLSTITKTGNTQRAHQADKTIDGKSV